MDLTSGLRCGLRFASGSEHTDLTDRLFLLFSKVKIQLLQPQTPLTALFVVGLVRHIGARHSLLSEANGGRHSRVSDSSVGALQHFLSRNATAFISPYKIAFLIFKAVNPFAPSPAYKTQHIYKHSCCWLNETMNDL
jgi:hypothetical protein